MTATTMTGAAAACEADRRDALPYIARMREHGHTLAAEALCDLGERAMARRSRPRKPLAVRIVLAACAVAGAVFGIYSH